MPSYIQNDAETRLKPHPTSRESTALDVVNPAELGLVVDQSGSMAPLADQLVASFNILLDDQKKIGIGVGVEGAVSKKNRIPAVAAVPPIVSLSLFGSTVHPVHDGVPAADVPTLTLANYRPSGGTALNDGIGMIIQSIGRRAKRSARVMVAILTDGGENSSNQFSNADILQMVSYRRINYDWQFVFIGPKEAGRYAVSIGIPVSNIVSFDADPAGLKQIMNRLSKSVRAYQLGYQKYHLLLKDG
jgi:hypothetical protein